MAQSFSQDRSHGEPEEPHDVSRPHGEHKTPYITIFWVLVALTVVTFLVAQHRFESEIYNVLLALLVAAFKAACVVLFFMHMRYEGKLIYTIFIVPLVLCVLLVTAVIPDTLLTAHDSDSASLHHMNPPSLGGVYLHGKPAGGGGH